VRRLGSVEVYTHMSKDSKGGDGQEIESYGKAM